MADVTEATTTTAGAGTDPGAATGAGTQPGGTSTAAERTFTQDDVNRLLAEEKRKAKAAADAESARQKAAAAEEAAKAAGEWEQVAVQREQRATAAEGERDSLRAERDALAAEIEAEIKPRLRALPETLRDLVPSDASPAARLAAVRKLEAAAATLAAQQTPGTPTGPRGNGATAPTGATPEDLKNQKRARIGGL
jgi:hypothetical protein